ncbi:MAG: hypothetical protein WCR02_04185 [Sphaerochaetaceae bacterium]
MNRKIGIFASATNLLGVAGFAISMGIGASLFWSYLTSIVIAFSFVTLMGVYAYFSEESTKAAGFCALAFGAMYALCNSLVYFTQLTTVQHGMLNGQATALLDFQEFGLMFNWDMLGYCLMAVSTFFIGLTIKATTKPDTWLKWLLLIHGVFALSCFIIPTLGIFNKDMNGAGWVGTLILEFWCLYFAPISILSWIHFLKKKES